MVDLNLIIGIVGMFLILISFILDEFTKRFKPRTIQYNLLNMFGSGLLAYYAIMLKGWPFLILNLVWFVVAGIKLIKILNLKK